MIWSKPIHAFTQRLQSHGTSHHNIQQNIGGISKHIRLFSTALESDTETNFARINTDEEKHNLIEDIQEIDLFKPYFPIYYNDVYKVPLPKNHRFPMNKYHQVRVRVQEYILPIRNETNVQCEFRISPLASLNDLQTTHCPLYIDRYVKGEQTEAELRNVGFPWSQKGVDRSFSSTGGTIAASTALCLLKSRQLQHQAALAPDEDSKEYGMLFSAHVAGGTHHAFRDYGEGFCIFSDIAVAANVILRDYDFMKNILIIDLDVHQGNGNAVLFQDIEEVKTFSMHCSANYFSPKEKSDLDIELPAGVTDETYLVTLHHWLKQIEAQNGKIDFVFFQAGVDILEQDRLGRMNISYEGIERRNLMIFDFAKRLKVPLMISMGGGYPRNDWEPILKAHTRVYTQAYDYLVQNEKC